MAGCLTRWLAGWLARCLGGWRIVDWLVSWLAGWLFGCWTGWLGRWRTGWFVRIIARSASGISRLSRRAEIARLLTAPEMMNSEITN